MIIRNLNLKTRSLPNNYFYFAFISSTTQDHCIYIVNHALELSQKKYRFSNHVTILPIPRIYFLFLFQYCEIERNDCRNGSKRKV